MNLRLTPLDHDRLLEAQRVLLSPLDYSTHEEWMLDALETMKQLLGASQASAHFPNGEFATISADYSASALESYESYAPEVWNDFSMGRRLQNHRVFIRDSLYGEKLSDYRRSEYYNECVVPAKALDAAGMSVSLRTSPDLETTVIPIMNRDSTAHPFGQREVALLKLIYPAFEAGVRIHTRLGKRKREFARAVDALGSPIRICSEEGAVLHQSPALIDLLDEDHQAEELEAAMTRIVSVLRQNGSADFEPADPVSASVHTNRDRYHVSGCIVNEGVFSRDPCVMIVIEGSEQAAPNENDLRERFGLTPQEARVSLLLCRRRSNREIAQALAISEHTARHHTEQVFQKLGIHTRKEVASRLSSIPRRR